MTHEEAKEKLNIATGKELLEAVKILETTDEGFALLNKELNDNLYLEGNLIDRVCETMGKDPEETKNDMRIIYEVFHRNEN